MSSGLSLVQALLDQCDRKLCRPTAVKHNETRSDDGRSGTRLCLHDYMEKERKRETLSYKEDQMRVIYSLSRFLLLFLFVFALVERLHPKSSSTLVGVDCWY